MTQHSHCHTKWLKVAERTDSVQSIESEATQVQMQCEPRNDTQTQHLIVPRRALSWKTTKSGNHQRTPNIPPLIAYHQGVWASCPPSRHRATKSR
ncbi:UNVERIFIED_CONTAM: hypothetical protein Sradi_7219400 [Sesamum radiatum]|uniref:Uncharacterized protein n=3 Tax=Sesamum TaxID=4181 RepID=A0AAW2SH96_9LAMI